MILRSAEEAIKEVLQPALNDVTGLDAATPILFSDEDETKPQMPYIILQCVSSEEQITPGCGIFKVEGTLVSNNAG